MDVDKILEQLFEAAIIERTSTGDDYALTARFQTTVQRYREAFDRTEGQVTPDDIQDLLEPDVTFPNRLDDIDPAILAEYCAVMDHLDGQSAAVFLFAVLDQFSPDPIPEDGAPEAFLSVQGPRLPFLIQCYSAVIVYVWRRECPPCDVIKDDLNELFGAQHNELLLVSVFGPDWAQFLERRYDVVGAPTLLFVVNGTVDARLIGSAGREAIEHEIELLRELSGEE